MNWHFSKLSSFNQIAILYEFLEQDSKFYDFIEKKKFASPFKRGDLIVNNSGRIYLIHIICPNNEAWCEFMCHDIFPINEDSYENGTIVFNSYFKDFHEEEKGDYDEGPDVIDITSFKKIEFINLFAGYDTFANGKVKKSRSYQASVKDAPTTSLKNWNMKQGVIKSNL